METKVALGLFVVVAIGVWLFARTTPTAAQKTYRAGKLAQRGYAVVFILSFMIVAISSGSPVLIGMAVLIVAFLVLHAIYGMEADPV